MMEMRCRGVGVYHAGPGGIEKPGDFGYRQDEYGTQLAMYCPKFGVCLIRIHQAVPNQAEATWQWNGSVEKPTIVPSIGCDHPPRCGQHVTITDGVIQP